MEKDKGENDKTGNKYEETYTICVRNKKIDVMGALDKGRTLEMDAKTAGGSMR